MMNQPVRHVSFDVWKTLLSANPQFGPLRSSLVAKTLARDYAEVHAAIREVKDRLDMRAEEFGLAVSCDDAYGKLLDVFDADHGLIPALRAGFELLFELYPPIIERETVHMLRALERQGLTISLGTNTNFISGMMLEDYFRTNYDIGFNFVVASDEIGCSKPHDGFFAAILTQARNLHPTIKPEEILHVGDNPVCDYDGATKANMKCLIVSDVKNVAGPVINYGGLHAAAV